MMNRYLLFCGLAYYPCGGAEDFHKGFKTWEDIESYLKNEFQFIEYDWFHVFDVVKGKIIYKNRDANNL
jgi:hypothetical protein